MKGKSKKKIKRNVKEVFKNITNYSLTMPTLNATKWLYNTVFLEKISCFIVDSKGNLYIASSNLFLQKLMKSKQAFYTESKCKVVIS